MISYHKVNSRSVAYIGLSLDVGASVKKYLKNFNMTVTSGVVESCCTDLT